MNSHCTTKKNHHRPLQYTCRATQATVKYSTRAIEMLRACLIEPRDPVQRSVQQRLQVTALLLLLLLL